LIKYILSAIIVLLGVLSCTKDVQIDLPQLAPQLVVDGNIEAGAHPLVLLSMSQPAADTVSLLTYLNSVVSDAQVTVVNGTDTFALTPTYIQQLPLESQKRVAEMLRLELEEVLIFAHSGL
jgi:hypothetical protein